MRMTYWELVGKRVLSADGVPLGRLADLVAERRGDDLCVTALTIGAQAVMRRIAFSQLPRIGAEPFQISWEKVARIDQRIHLTLTHEEVKQLAKASSREKGA